MRDVEFVNGEYYHIFERGVDRRSIFLEFSDYERFFQSMFLFNDATYFDHKDPFDKIVRMSGYEIFEHERTPFVRIIAYTLLPNHFHFLVQQLSDQGISKFLQKLKKGYSRYFNLKYERVGTLYQGPFRAKHINTDSYAHHTIPYIHLNILDLGKHNWRDGEVQNWAAALDEMDRYEWSSHRFYRGQDQPLPLVDLHESSQLLGSDFDYLALLREWSKRNLAEEVEEGLVTVTSF